MMSFVYRLKLLSLYFFLAVIFTFQHTNKAQAAEERRIACVGDSITYGSGLLSSQRNVSSYPAKLKEMLDKRVSTEAGIVWKVGNYGFRGATATNKSRLSYETSPLFIQTWKWLPDFVVVMLGTNDIMINVTLKTFRDDFTYLLTRIDDIPRKPKIILMLPPWMDVNYPSRAERFRGINQAAYQNIIRSIAKDNNVFLLDVYSIFENKPHLFADGLHPNAEGYNLIAQLVVQALESLGEIQPVKLSSTTKTKISSTGADKQAMQLRGTPFLARSAHFNKKDNRAEKSKKEKKLWLWGGN